MKRGRVCCDRVVAEAIARCGADTKATVIAEAAAAEAAEAALRQLRDKSSIKQQRRRRSGSESEESCSSGGRTEGACSYTPSDCVLLLRFAREQHAASQGAAWEAVAAQYNREASRPRTVESLRRKWRKLRRSGSLAHAVSVSDLISHKVSVMVPAGAPTPPSSEAGEDDVAAAAAEEQEEVAAASAPTAAEPDEEVVAQPRTPEPLPLPLPLPSPAKSPTRAARMLHMATFKHDDTEMLLYGELDFGSLF